MKLCQDINTRLGLPLKVVKLNKRERNYLIYFGADNINPLTKRWLNAREVMIVLEGVELFALTTRSYNVPGTNNSNILETTN